MARILVIDDDPSVRTAIRNTLQMDGHEIEEAIDGQSGIELYRKDPPDLVITGADSVLRRCFLSMLHRHSQGVHHWHIEPVYTDSRKHPIVLT